MTPQKLTRLTFETEDRRIVIETDRGDYNIHDLFDELIVPMLRGVGYHEDSIREALAE